MNRVLKIASSQGCLGKNLGCESAPKDVLKYVKNEFLIDEVDIDVMNIERTNQSIHKKAKNFSGVILGGDHSVTYASFRALASRYRRCALIMMDAHVDCTSYIKPPSHEDFLRVLIEDRIVDTKDIVIVGVRRMYCAEERYLERKKLKLITANKVSCFKDVVEHLKEADAIYLSIDIDVFDPEIAIGTGYKVKGGLDKKTAMAMLRSVKKLKNLKIVDIVEVNPLLDKGNKTVRLAASLVDFFYG